jgi:hypothetical protein
MSAWTNISGSDLRQGDLLDRCVVPLLDPNFGEREGPNDVQLTDVRLAILTQSCDLVIRPGKAEPKATSVALCRVYSLEEYSRVRSDFVQPKIREDARTGRIEGIHLLHSLAYQNDNQTVLIAHFREIFSLPFAYLQRHAASLNDRPRLQSPYLEHFAQGFARFFMRVGLPLDIPAYR